jgi:hypothetical protein
MTNDVADTPAPSVGGTAHCRVVARRKPASGIPVVVDEWAVLLWSDAKLSANDVSRLVTLVSLRLAELATDLDVMLAAMRSGPGAPTRIEIVPHGR